MKLRILAALAAFLAGPPAAGDAAFLRHFAGGGAGGGGGGGTALALTRIFNNPTGSPTGATAFWMIGEPFKNTFSDPSGLEITADEVPSGNIVTCKLGGRAGDSSGTAVAVPCSLVGRKIAADNSVEWGQLLVDFSGLSIPAGGQDTLVLTSTAGTFCDAQGTGTCLSGFTDANWTALNDSVTLSNVTLGGPGHVAGGCGGTGSLTAGTTYYLIATYTNAAGESMPTNLGGGGGTFGHFTAATGCTAFSVSLLDFGPASLGLTGWKLYACTGSCANYPNDYWLQATTTGTGSATMSTYTSSGSHPPTSSSLGGTLATVAGSGTWVAKFDGLADDDVATVISDSPQGRQVKVVAHPYDTTALPNFTSASWTSGTETVNFSALPTGGEALTANDTILLFSGAAETGSEAICPQITINTGSHLVTCAIANPGFTVSSVAAINRNIRVTMYYWATCKASGNTCNTAGPVESWGPYIENDLIYPKSASPYYANSTLAAYQYDAKFTRNGTDIRGGAAAGGTAYNGLVSPFMAISPMVRNDGQADWSASDPGIVVTQDYAQLVDTRKVPPFVKGLTFVGGQSGCSSGGICIVYNTGITASSANTLTPVNGKAIFDQAFTTNGVGPESVELDGTLGTCTPSCPGGTGHIYWAVFQAGQPPPAFTIPFCLYDTLQHALVANNCVTTTGQFQFSGTWTGATVQSAAAPANLGQYALQIWATASRPELQLITEWGAAGIVGNTANWQRLSRVQGYVLASIPGVVAIDGNASDTGVGHIVSLTSSGRTPTGMSVYQGDTWFADGLLSNDLNSGVTPPGGFGNWVGGWDTTGSGRQHTFNGAWAPFILEGDPFFRDMNIYWGHQEVAADSLTSRTNILVSGTNYPASFACVWDGSSSRRAGWALRNFGEAAFATYAGSPEETYYYNILNDNMAECAAYQNFEGAGYKNLGFTIYMEANYPPGTSTGSTGAVETFMDNFVAASMGWSALLDLDYVPGLLTQDQYMGKWLVTAYNSTRCPYWGTAYLTGIVTGNISGSAPFTYAATLGDTGVTISTNQVTFNNTVPDITQAQAWTTALPVDHNFKVFFNDYAFSLNPGPNPGSPPPSPFVTGTYYFVLPNTGSFSTYRASATNNGGAIQAGSVPANPSGGWMVPPLSTTEACPFVSGSGGGGSFAVGNSASGDTYWTQQMTSLALMAELNVTNANAAYTTGNGLFTGAAAPVYSQTIGWGMGPP